MNKEKLVPKLRFKFSSDWESKKLKDIIQISKEKYNPDSDKTNYKCIELEHLSQETGLLLGFTDSINQNSIKNKFHKENILFGKLRPYLKKFYYPNFDGVCSSEIWVFDTKEYSKYIYYLIQSKRFIDISNVSSGSKMPRSDWNFMKDFIFPIPDIKTQKETANLFSGIDNKIELLEKKHKAYEDFKKYLMQQIFAQKLRFNGFKEEWEENFVEDVFDITRGEVIAKTLIKEFPTEEYCYPVFSSQTTNKGIMGYFNDFDFDGEFITWTTDGANAGKTVYRNGKFKCSNVWGVLKAKKEYGGFANQFIAEYLDSITHKYVSYVGNPKLMNNVMARIKIKYPPLEEQQKISDLLKNMDLSIDTIQNQIKNVKQFKKGLLQQMFV